MHISEYYFPLLRYKSSSSSVRLDEDCWWTAVFRCCCRFSIGFRSGCTLCVIVLQEGELDAQHWAPTINFPVPAEEKHPHSMMPPPPCFMMGMMCSGLWFSANFTFRLKSSILLSHQSTFHTNNRHSGEFFQHSLSSDHHKDHLVACSATTCPVDRFSYQSCGSLQLIHGGASWLCLGRFGLCHLSVFRWWIEQSKPCF